MDLNGKLALVTGATRGIGQAVALMLGKRGVKVIGTATSAAGKSTIDDYLAAHDVQGEGMVVNVAEQDSRDALIAALAKEHTLPDILVNNAGITRDNLLLRMKSEEWNEVIATNLTSVFHLSKASIKHMMKKRWGRIINISSVVGSTGNPGQVNYSASKAGIEGLTRSLASELASRHITVNAVAPGFIQTDMTDKLPEQQKEALMGQIPLGRLGDVNDIASAVAFLASGEASYITGHTLHVNGGMYMK